VQYAETFDEFDSVIGLDNLKLFHVNDSEGEWCSCVDRHAGLGRGKIGIDAFRRLVTDPRFASHPMILETPKEDEQRNPMDPINLALLRGFASNAATQLA
jgi:deoxyribonuclease-4